MNPGPPAQMQERSALRVPPDVRANTANLGGRKRKRFAFDERQDKAGAFLQALEAHGYERVPRWQDGAGFMFRNLDTHWEDLEAARAAGVRMFLHPHAVRMCCFWDGLYSIWPHTACNFAPGIGHKMVMQAYRYPIPVEVVGWPYSEVRLFQPTSGERVLFAPIHPNLKGRRLTTQDKATNRQAFDVLRKLKVQLKVRYFHALQHNGLDPEPAPGVEYEQAELKISDSIGAIEQADVVIAHQTFAWLAVALGKPTLMMNEHLPPHNIRRPVRSWPKYQKILQYPLDLLHCKNPREEMAEACRSDERIRLWRERFIGQPFDGGRFVETLERYLNG